MAAGEYVVKESSLDFKHISKVPDGSVQEDLLNQFRSQFKMNILEQGENELVIEFIHVDTSFVNALRRILLAEVPSVAIEHVYIMDNSSILHDEILSHRLGLVPLNVDARLLEEVSRDSSTESREWIPTDRNTVVFSMQVECGPNPGTSKTAINTDITLDADSDGDNVDDDDDDDSPFCHDPELEQAAREAMAGANHRFTFAKDRPYTLHVHASDLKYVAQGDQGQFLGTDVGPLHPDILLAKLRPGQAISLEAHARRGIGKDHAKFSPVATASYRLMPRIEILEPIYDELADELVHVYEPGVFELIPTEYHIDPPTRTRKARVCNPYACTMSRNYTRDPDLNRSIRMSRIPDHFIFSIESLGTYSPGVLLAEAIRVLQGKCRHLVDIVDAYRQQQF